jgi:hypothetical protein
MGSDSAAEAEEPIEVLEEPPSALSSGEAITSIALPAILMNGELGGARRRPGPLPPPAAARATP